MTDAGYAVLNTLITTVGTIVTTAVIRFSRRQSKKENQHIQTDVTEIKNAITTGGGGDAPLPSTIAPLGDMKPAGRPPVKRGES